MEVPYKSFKYLHSTIWCPFISIRIAYNDLQTAKFDALIDSGSQQCLFRADVGESIGIKIEQGEPGSVTGVVAAMSTKIWYHNVKLLIGQDGIDIRAGFSRELDCCILGQHGFFDNYVVTFNPLTHPPTVSFFRVQSN